METKPVLNKVKLFFRWLLVNTFGMSVVISIITIFFSLSIGGILPWSISRISLASILAFPFGGLQWFVLKGYIINAEQWIMAGFTGIVVGAVITEGGIYLTSNRGISEICLGLMAGAIIGITLGTSQWFILRRHISHSWLWVLANILGLSIGAAWGWPYFSNSRADDIGIVYYFIVFVFRLMIAHGVFTGVLLVWLFNQSTKRLQTTAA